MKLFHCTHFIGVFQNTWPNSERLSGNITGVNERRKLNASLRKDREVWWSHCALVMELGANTGNYRKLFRLIWPTGGIWAKRSVKLTVRLPTTSSDNLYAECRTLKHNQAGPQRQSLLELFWDTFRDPFQQIYQLKRRSPRKSKPWETIKRWALVVLFQFHLRVEKCNFKFCSQRSGILMKSLYEGSRLVIPSLRRARVVTVVTMRILT